jgi:dynein heavy chain 1
MITKLLKMQLLEDDDDEFAYTAPGAEADVGKSADGRPAWMRTLQTSADALLQLLPNSIQVLRRTVENIKDPLYRFFEREVNLGAKLLKEIRQDLNDVIQICMVSLLQRN